MSWKTGLTLLVLGNAVSATFGPQFMPSCWKKCAKDAGLQCDWTDTECLCEAANEGIMAKANSCACGCNDMRLGMGIMGRLRTTEMSVMCKMAGVELSEGAMGSGPSCGGSSEGSEEEGKPPIFGLGPPKVGRPGPSFSRGFRLFDSEGSTAELGSSSQGGGSPDQSLVRPMPPGMSPPAAMGDIPRPAGPEGGDQFGLNLGGPKGAKDEEQSTSSIMVTVPVIPVPASTATPSSGDVANAGVSSGTLTFEGSKPHGMPGKGPANFSSPAKPKSNITEFAGMAGANGVNWASAALALGALIVIGAA